MVINLKNDNERVYEWLIGSKGKDKSQNGKGGHEMRKRIRTMCFIRSEYSRYVLMGVTV